MSPGPSYTAALHNPMLLLWCCVQVAHDTEAPGGEHKVKLASVIVQEEAGQIDGISNAAAVEHVHDILFRHTGVGSGNGVFDIRNHI